MGKLKLKPKKEEADQELASPPFRPGTKTFKTRFGFIYNAGGIGDYIMWTTALQWVLETHKHLVGIIATPPYFAQLAKHWLSPYRDRFEILVTEDFTKEEKLEGIPCLIPDRRQLANANSYHLFTLGWIYFAQLAEWQIPRDWLKLPEIRGDEADLTKFNLPPRYAVIPVSATADNRRLPARVVREISSHLLSRGITPVYLGKKSLASDYSAKTDEELDLSMGVDLREKTNLLEAASIMANGEMTVGLDGGLLHLACCSKTDVIFGFTSVDPKTRVPPRPKEYRTATIVPPEELACRFCQTNMKFLVGHDFINCLYKDLACITQLPSAPFIKAIDGLLDNPRGK